MNIQFIYDIVESNYSNLDCYSIYDFTTNELVHDVKLNKSVVRIDRNNKIIYFMGMETEGLWILEKNYYYKIIQEFMNNLEMYNCNGYLVYEDTTGGQLYYKYK